MKKNRKRADTYRFNGNPAFHPGSIHSVEMADLERWLERFEAKLSDPTDPDDRKWTARWLSRLREELAKKQQGRDLKQRERLERHRTTKIAP